VILYPAIDIRDGHAVRLVEGDYDRETVYDADPVDAAMRFADAGVHVLHVVDLDGAKAGEPKNLEVIRRIADAVPFPIQVGGGLRTADSVAGVLRAGAEHVVIGTAAMRDPEFLEAMLKAHGEGVVVSVDARDGKVSLAGWTEASDVVTADAVADLTAPGLQRFL
jgi:phosphoribosylformimino-5-aminoimidazole carboxamide ribotide isomerase